MRITFADRPRATVLIIGTIISFNIEARVGIAFLAGAFIASIHIELNP